MRVPPIHQPDYSDPKEPYSFFGLAAYYAQCFEQSLILLLVSDTLLNDELRMKFGSMDELFWSMDKNTMGMSINRILKRLSVEPEIATMLKDVLEKRNYLMHHFFPENIDK